MGSRGMRMVVAVAAFLFCLGAGSVIGMGLGLAANFLAADLRVQAPLTYKAILYGCYLYVPFLILTLSTAALRWIPGRGLAAILAYLALTGSLFVLQKYPARGMELASRAGYALALFGPAVVFAALGLGIARWRGTVPQTDDGEGSGCCSGQ